MSTTAPSVPARPPAEPLYRTDLTYADRAQKAAYIADKYGAILAGSVLDVGCDRSPLRVLVGTPTAYVGVDIDADADVSIDLDKADLPVAAQGFDTVVCTDVLEHLERCHAVFDELCRVARRHVIVSLPNPLRNLLIEVTRGSAGRLKYYGLPVDRPADRHRWFFGFEEAAEFLRVRGGRAGFEVEQLDCEEGGCPSWRGRDGRDYLASANVRAGTLWCVLRRRDGR